MQDKATGTEQELAPSGHFTQVPPTTVEEYPVKQVNAFTVGFVDEQVAAPVPHNKQVPAVAAPVTAVDKT